MILSSLKQMGESLPVTPLGFPLPIPYSPKCAELAGEEELEMGLLGVLTSEDPFWCSPQTLGYLGW